MLLSQNQAKQADSPANLNASFDKKLTVFFPKFRILFFTALVAARVFLSLSLS